jgi:hypothetical protein
MRRSLMRELNPSRPAFARVARKLTTLRVPLIPILVASAGATSDCRSSTAEADVRAQRRGDSVSVFENVSGRAHCAVGCSPRRADENPYRNLQDP